MPRVQMPDGTIVDMPEDLTPEMATRLKAFRDSQTPRRKRPTPDPFAGVASPVGSTDPFAGVASPVPNQSPVPTPDLYAAFSSPTGNSDPYASFSSPTAANHPPAPVQGVIGDSLPPAVPSDAAPITRLPAKRSKLGDIANYYRNLASYAGDVVQRPSAAIGKGLATITGDKDFEFRGGVPLISGPEEVAANRAKLDPLSAMAVDVGANPLTYIMPGSNAQAPARIFGSKLAGTVGKSAAIGNTFATMDPEATPGSIATATTASALTPLAVDKVLAPLARGTINAVKGIWGRAATPEASDVASQFTQALKGRAGNALQDDLETQYNAARARGAAPFKALEATDGDVNLPQYEMDLLAAIDDVKNSRAGADPKILSELERLYAGITNPKASKGWGSALEIGSDLNATLGDAMKGANPNRNLARILAPLKDSLQADMDRAGAASGEAYQAAKAGWLKEVVPWEDPTEGAKFLKNFMNSPTPNDSMRALTMMGPDKAKIFFRQAGPQGRSALQAGLVQTAFEEAADSTTGKFVPSKFLKAMNDRQDLYGLVFTGTDRWKMDGFQKLMQDANFVDHFLPGKWGVKASQAAEKLFTTPAGSQFLLGASSLNPSSKAMGNFISRNVPKVFGAASGRGVASPSDTPPPPSWEYPPASGQD